MHVYTICKARAMHRELAENRAKVCMLGLSVLRESWPVGGWVYQLFVSIMLRLQSRIHDEGHICRPGGSSVPSQTMPLEHSPTLSQATNTEDYRGASIPPRYHRGTGTEFSLGHDSTESQHDHENGLMGLMERHHMPDIFAFGDTISNTMSDESAFFNMLNFPNWT